MNDKKKIRKLKTALQGHSVESDQQSLLIIESQCADNTNVLLKLFN